MVKFDKVHKFFGKYEALKDVSFELKKGDITGLLGPNGAGKTTTMRLIAGFYFPEKGKITINGQQTNTNLQSIQSQIGYMPENNPLYGEMLVAEFLEMSARLNKLDPTLITSRVKEVAKSVDILKKLTSPINSLSKGYKQRVGIAAALVHNPEILILDEPTEGLDPILRNEIRTLIKEIAKNKTILISTHVLQEVHALCNKVLIINEGKILKFGKPEDLNKTKVYTTTLSGENVEKKIKEFCENNDYSLASLSENKKDEATYNISIESKEEIRPNLSKLAAKNGWTIWQLIIEDSLEQLFKNLNKEND